MSQLAPDDMFPGPVPVQKIDVLPVSVIDIGAQASLRRSRGGHDAKSSRAEYSHFPAEVASLCYQLYLRNATWIFDPFAGWGERGAHAKAYGLNYLGFDISKDAIDAAMTTFGVLNRQADSEHDPIPPFDGLITCPPYWNLENYSGGGLECAPSYDEFLQRYYALIRHCYGAAAQGCTFCVMVGDWRDGGKYYDLTHQTRTAFYHCGAEPVDEVCVSRQTISKIKVMIPQAVRLGYTVKVHETLLVFRKP